MAEFEKFTCSLTNVDGRVEIGSGVIAQIDLEGLLQGPSSLEKKVHGELSAQEKCYALITARSNVYKDCGPKAPEPSVVECLRDRRKVVLANSDHLKTIDKTHVSCRAVSCCGIDSMLRMPQPSRDPTHGPQVRPLDHTLKSHDRNLCNIGYDFVVVFLKSELVRQWFPEDSFQPPMLSLTLCSRLPNILEDKLEVHVYWRSDKGSVTRQMVGIRPGHLKSQPQVQGLLGDEISHFEAYQSLECIPQEGEGASGIQSHVGAPVFCTTRTGTSHLIGINTGEGVTSFYGILNLLKGTGGVVPFLAAMQHPTANARSLKPSRWKDYILDHVDPHIQSLGESYRGHYVVDLLHYLLEKRAEQTIVKLAPSDDMDDVVAGLNVLTALFNKLKNVQGVHQCCDGIKCLREFCSTDLHKCLQHFAKHPGNPHNKNMVEAMFECFEALLNYQGIAREVLSRNNNIMKPLIEIATSEHYESNAVVNRCFKTIIVMDRTYLIEELEQYRGHERYSKPLPATD